MAEPNYIKSVMSLNDRIRWCAWEQVEQMLANPNIPVNFNLKHVVNLPLTCMLDLANPKMAQLFINCPRIDWLAPTSDRCMLALNGQFGIQYESPKNKENKKGYEYFYCLPNKFVEKCPEEAEIIYKLIIDEVLKLTESDNHEELLFRACNSLTAFKIALNYCNINVKSKTGAALLHATESLEVAKLLIEMGVDVNFMDNQGGIPLWNFHSSLELKKLLIDNGADTCVLSQNGHSLLSSIDPRNADEFLKTIPISEEAFISALNGCGLDTDIVMKVLAKYPRFKEIFESDLPRHLATLKDAFKTDYFKKLSDEELSSLLKHIVDKSFNIPYSLIFEFPKNKMHLLVPFIPDMICFAAKLDNCALVKLICDKLKPNLDKALCVAGGGGIKDLLERGANPSADFDGYKFFDINPNLSKITKFKAETLLNCHMKGFDFFLKSTNTGKSFVDYLNPKCKILIKFDSKIRAKYTCLYVDFFFPAAKLSPLFFRELLKSEQDLFAPIDLDGNTMLHYANTSIHLPLSDLKRVPNKAGKTAYDVTIENYPDFEHGALVLDDKDSRAYIDDYVSRYGDDVFRRRGGTLLITALNKCNQELANFLVDEIGISIHRILKNQTVATILDNYPSDASFMLLLKNGYEFCAKTFECIMRWPRMKALNAIHDDPIHGPGWIPRICGHEENTSPSTICEIIKHKNVRNFISPNSESGCKILDHYYFILCRSAETFKVLKTLGADARHLIGTRDQPMIPDYVICYSVHYWQRLDNDGWTVDDFRKLGVYDDFAQSDRFRAVFPEFQVTYERINLIEIHGDKINCSICKEPFKSDEPVDLLVCKHLFHTACMKGARSDECPYCRKLLFEDVSQV